MNIRSKERQVTEKTQTFFFGKFWISQGKLLAFSDSQPCCLSVARRFQKSDYNSVLYDILAEVPRQIFYPATFPYFCTRNSPVALTQT
jgi:hypothetical protein